MIPNFQATFTSELVQRMQANLCELGYPNLLTTRNSAARLSTRYEISERSPR